MAHITEKQKRCIFALSKRLEDDVDTTKLCTLTLEAASQTIDVLQARLEEGKEVAIKVTEKPNINNVVFGMATKCVYKRWSDGHTDPVVGGEKFIKNVIDTYDLFMEAQKRVSSSPVPKDYIKVEEGVEKEELR